MPVRVGPMASHAMDTRERVFYDETIASGGVNAIGVLFASGKFEKSGSGSTRLFFAAQNGWLPVIKYLLEYGADVHVGYTPIRMTPLQGAAKNNRLRAAVLLLDAGARVDDRNSDDWTALQIASKWGYTNVCKLLVSRGASLDARTKNYGDAEAEARSLSHTATADFLAAVRAAGGWAAYARAPRVQLLMLRILCEQGRAVAPPGLLARLFPHETERRASLRSARHAPALPKELFWHIAQFWRSDRDSRY